MFTLKFATGNAAFSDDPTFETARILHDIAEDIEAGRTSGKIIDYNGNSIGEWSHNNEEEEN